MWSTITEKEGIIRSEVDFRSKVNTRESDQRLGTVIDHVTGTGKSPSHNYNTDVTRVL